MSSEIGGRTFYFCGSNCLNTFANPEKELSKLKKRMYVAASGVRGSVARKVPNVASKAGNFLGSSRVCHAIYDISCDGKEMVNPSGGVKDFYYLAMHSVPGGGLSGS